MLSCLRAGSQVPVLTRSALAEEERGLGRGSAAPATSSLLETRMQPKMCLTRGTSPSTYLAQDGGDLSRCAHVQVHVCSKYIPTRQVGSKAFGNLMPIAHNSQLRASLLLPQLGLLALKKCAILAMIDCFYMNTFTASAAYHILMCHSVL